MNEHRCTSDHSGDTFQRMRHSSRLQSSHGPPLLLHLRSRPLSSPYDPPPTASTSQFATSETRRRGSGRRSRSSSATTLSEGAAETPTRAHNAITPTTLASPMPSATFARASSSHMGLGLGSGSSSAPSSSPSAGLTPSSISRSQASNRGQPPQSFSMTVFEHPLRTNQLTCYEENGALSLLNKVFDAFLDTGRELNLAPFVLLLKQSRLMKICKELL